MRMGKVAWTVFVLLGLACSSGGSKDAAADDSGGSCNGSVCAANELCIHPCCGGAQPVCSTIPDGGCPQGTIELSNCPPTAAPGCQEVCEPPPSYCSPTLPIGCSVDSRTGDVVCACA